MITVTGAVTAAPITDAADSPVALRSTVPMVRGLSGGGGSAMSGCPSPGQLDMSGDCTGGAVRAGALIHCAGDAAGRKRADLRPWLAGAGPRPPNRRPHRGADARRVRLGDSAGSNAP